MSGFIERFEPVRSRRHLGFSLIEMVFVLALLGAIAGMLAVPMSSLMNSQSVLSQDYLQKADVDYVLGRISRDIRAASEITVCTAETLVLRVAGTTVSYSRNGSTLVLNADESLLDSVGSDTILCDDRFADPLDIYRVELSVGQRTYRIACFRRLVAA